MALVFSENFESGTSPWTFDSVTGTPTEDTSTPITGTKSLALGVITGTDLLLNWNAGANNTSGATPEAGPNALVIHGKANFRIADYTLGTNRNIKFFQATNGVTENLSLVFRAHGQAELNSILIRYRNAANSLDTSSHAENDITSAIPAEGTAFEVRWLYIVPGTNRDGVIKVWVDDVLVINFTDSTITGGMYTTAFDEVTVGMFGNSLAGAITVTIDDINLSSTADFDTAAGSAEYYIDHANGDDTAAGSAAAPLKTGIGAINWAIGGDTIKYVNNAAQYPNRVSSTIVGYHAGTAGSPITFTSDTGKAVITGCHDYTGLEGAAVSGVYPYAAPSVPQDPGRIYVGTATNWTALGFAGLSEVVTTATTTPAAGAAGYSANVIYYKPDAGVSISDLHIEIPLVTDIFDNDTADYVNYINLDVRHPCDRNIRISGLDNCLIESCNFYSSGNDAATGGSVQINDCASQIINSTLSGSIAMQSPLGMIHLSGSGNSKAIGCVVKNYYDDGIVIIGTGEKEVNHCTVANVGGGADSAGITIHNNMSGVPKAFVRGCTIVGCTNGIQYTENFLPAAGNMIVTECVIAHCTKGLKTNNSHDWANVSNMTIYNCTTAHDAGITLTETTTDPLFTSAGTTIGVQAQGARDGDDYSLQSTSPEVGNGTYWWGATPPPVGANGEPFTPSATDRGAVQSTHNTFHPANI